MKLRDRVTQILRVAARRDDRHVLTAYPGSSRSGAAMARAIESALASGYIEVRGHHYGPLYRLTQAGLDAARAAEAAEDADAPDGSTALGAARRP